MPLRKPYFSAAFVGGVNQPRHVRPSPRGKLRVLGLQINFRQLPAEGGLGAGFILGLEKFFGLGTVFRAKTYAGTGYAVFSVEGATGAIWSLIEPEFRLHVLSLSGLLRNLGERLANPLMSSRMVATAFCPLFEKFCCSRRGRDTFGDTCPKKGPWDTRRKMPNPLFIRVCGRFDVMAEGVGLSRFRRALPFWLRFHDWRWRAPQSNSVLHPTDPLLNLTALDLAEGVGLSRLRRALPFWLRFHDWRWRAPQSNSVLHPTDPLLNLATSIWRKGWDSNPRNL